MSEPIVLKSKIFISGKIKVVTGLHIGGSRTALDIGGIDLNVIKSPTGIPYIPGSSLKGKLRSLLARRYGSVAVRPEKDAIEGEKTDRDFPVIVEIFGDAKESDTLSVTRLIVRDAYLDKDKFNEKRKDSFTALEEDEYTEAKFENTIDRKSGTAKDPRQLERVPAGATFGFEMVYNCFSDKKEEGHLLAIREAMRLLEDDYLGGQGSRGYGKITFDPVDFTEKAIDDYQNKNISHPLTWIKYQESNDDSVPPAV